MLMSTPVAPAIEMLSSNGDEIACCAASIARFSPRPVPVPMRAEPPFCMMIGAAPVPVPPPMPQVTNTRSAPWMACSTSSRFSSIAWRPISGRAPAPSPRVSFLPIWTFTSALLFMRARASVLHEMNSTPCSCSSIIRFTALPPPPPTPTTFIRAFCATVSSSSKLMVCLGPGSKEVLQPSLHRSEPPIHAGAAPGERAAARRPLGHLSRRVQREPHRHGIARGLHAVHQPRDPQLGRPRPHRHGEHLAAQLDDPRQLRRPARQHHPGGQFAAAVPRPFELALHQPQDFVHALVDDVRQQLPRGLARALPARRRQVDHFRRIDQRLVRHALAFLQPLRIGLRDAQAPPHIAPPLPPRVLHARHAADLPL